jgi:hypothetical protein
VDTAGLPVVFGTAAPPLSKANPSSADPSHQGIGTT